MFGTGLVDQRTVDGVRVLCRIVARRILKTNIKNLDSIVRRVSKKRKES